MTRHLVFVFLAALLLASCSPSASKKAEEIERLQKELKQSGQQNMADTNKVKQLMTEYRFYIKNFPTDSLTPVYLMRQGEFYDWLLCPDSAIYSYSRVYTGFPAYPHADEALFREAYIYANEKNNLTMAKALYQLYLSKYPNIKRAKIVQQELHFLGKTPDQIMAELDSTKKTHHDTLSRRP